MKSESLFAKTPEPPYYAVIFTAQRQAGDRGYEAMAARMGQLAAEQPGFLGAETVRGEDGFGITVSYWKSAEAIAGWKAHMEHRAAQEAGQRVWYKDYQLRVAKVERAYGKPAIASGEFEVKVDDLSGPEIRGLLSEHLRSLAEVSHPESMHALNLDGLRRPEITFWSVWQGQELVGCGALKEWDGGHAEIKSMRTAKTHLRRGVASFLLAHIIAEAKRRGYRRVSLETGANHHFEPAHHLYRKLGFTVCPAFGDYAPDANSIFMARDLD